MPNYKYATNIKALDLKVECPPIELIGRNAVIYRYIFDDINHPNNFIPQYLKKPPRVLPFDDVKTCNGFGLSVFETVDQSITFFQVLPERIKKLLGYTHIAQIDLTTDDGKTTETEASGHFNLHEFEGVDLLPKSIKLREIISK